VITDYGHCKGCKWWDQWKPSPAWGYCTLAACDDDGIRVHKDAIAYVTCDSETDRGLDIHLITSERFGCRQFDVKEVSR